MRRWLGVYGAFMGMVPKMYLAYSIWVWVELLGQLLGMVVLYYFWQAIYASGTPQGGLSLQQTLNYALVAAMLAPLVEARFISRMGQMLREGEIIYEMLRPVDFQWRFYWENLAELLVDLAIKAPLLLVGVVAFGLDLPRDPLVWLVFAVSMLLGRTVLFFFNWLFACLAFYTTETWGLAVLYEGMATFFGGALLPLIMLPAWLQGLAYALPFAQILYVPISLLTGVTPLGQVGQVWLTQLAWCLGLALLSRWAFGRAVRVVTVQGG